MKIVHTTMTVHPIWHSTKSLLDYVSNGLRAIGTENHNDFFIVKRIGKQIVIASRRRLGGGGEIVLNADLHQVTELFRACLGRSYDEDTCPKLKGHLMKETSLGLNVSGLLIRRAGTLRLELVCAGEGTIDLGRAKFEMRQLHAFMDCKNEVIDLIRQINDEQSEQCVKKVHHAMIA